MQAIPFRLLGASLLGLGMLGRSERLLAQQDFPDFDLRVECASRVEGLARLPVRFPGTVILQTDPKLTDGSTGARAWSLSLRPRGEVRIVDPTTAGTAGDVGESGYQKTELTDGENNEGVVSAVILSLRDDVYLPGSGEAVLLRFSMESMVPESGCKDVGVEFSDGLTGSGQPVRNVVTWQAFSRRDDGGPDDLDTDGYENCAAAVCVESRLMRGDTTGDKLVNISDAVFFLDHLFRGGPTPRCLEAADVNDDGLLNVSDGVYLLSFLFRGGRSPLPPFPECGFPRTENVLSCDSASACN